MKSAEVVEGPLVDLELRDPERSSTSLSPVTLGPIRPAFESEASPSPVPAPPWAGRARSEASGAPGSPPSKERLAPATTGDLPLFLKRVPDADPVEVEPSVSPARPIESARLESDAVVLPGASRSPLSVRRRPSDHPRPKSVESAGASHRMGPFDRDLLENLDGVDYREMADRRADARTNRRSEERGEELDAAGPIKRLAAAIVDLLVLGGIGAAVVWATLRFCDLTVADARELSLLPAVPLAAFVLLVDLGYLLLFTAAGGQTIGKMAVGIRVVGAPDEGGGPRLTVQRAAIRALVTLPSILALGAGFLPALVGHRRAFHDRIAHTRVVCV